MKSASRFIGAACLATSLCLCGCFFSKTKIMATDSRSYEVYGNGALLCEDSQDCRIPQRGSPSTLDLELVKNGKVIGHTTVRREITTASVLWGFCTYFTSLYLYQAYPSEVFVPINYSVYSPEDNSNSRKSSWDTSPLTESESVWDKGPSSSNKEATAAEPPAPVAPAAPAEPAAPTAPDEY